MQRNPKPKISSTLMWAWGDLRKNPAKLSDSFFSYVRGSVRSWSRVFENTIVVHKLHHSCDIMAVEGFIEIKNDADR